MMQRVNILRKLEEAGVIAVVRGESAEKATKTAEAVIKGGLKGIELTFTVPQADQVIADLVTRYGDTDAVIGAGTVLDATTARLAIMAGAQFIVSPSFDADVAKMCNLYQIPYTPGCMTITEMQTALEAGVDLIKLFPGSVTGPGMVKAVLAPFPQLSIMPTGGVNLDNMQDWFKAGVTAVGAGSNLVGPASQGDYAGVTENAKKYAAELVRIRG